MSFDDIQRNRYPVHVITTHYYYSCQVEPKGPVTIWMNDPEFVAIRLLQANGAALEAGSAIDTSTREELVQLKQDIVVVDALSSEMRQTVPMMQRMQKVVFYTDRFVFNCSIPASAEARVDQLLDGLKGDFFPVVGVQVFPLRAVRPQLFRTSEMLLINRAHLNSYHAL